MKLNTNNYQSSVTNHQSPVSQSTSHQSPVTSKALTGALVHWCTGALATSALVYWCTGALVLFLFLGMASRPSVKPSVRIQTLKNNHYKLIVDNKPYIIRGVCYNPLPIGKDHDFDWWSDPNKPWIADGKLMKSMGINTIRVYQPGEDPEKVKMVIRDLYNLYGIRVIMGSWLGFWEYPCPFYADKKFQDRIRNEVMEMVNLYKDEPGILFWVLGNENNYSCLNMVHPWSSDEIDKEPDPQKQKIMRAKIYYSYVNELAQQIHKIDPAHPVALGNGETMGLEVAKDSCPDIDLIACIIYRGKTFGNLFRSVRVTFDKPLVLSEFGADAYDAYLGMEDQNMQALFLEAQWRQIYENFAGNDKGAGNCIGGVMFEWSDEWWKHEGNGTLGPGVHDTQAGWSNSSYYLDIKAKDNKNMNEEWFGLVALSEELVDGINKRVPRRSYYLIREFFKNPDKDFKLKGKKPVLGGKK